MKTPRILTMIALIALTYACSTTRRPAGTDAKPRTTSVTGVKPTVANPSIGVINASGDALTPGIGQNRSRGSEENAANIANNSIVRAQAALKNPAGSMDSLSAQDFITRVAENEAIEMNASRMAAQQSTRDKIKAYAVMITKDHGSIQQELKQLSAAKSISLAADPKSTSIGTENNFDFEYLQLMLTSHQKNIRLFELATRSKDAAISAFANKHLPALRKHLSAAQELTRLVRPGK